MRKILEIGMGSFPYFIRYEIPWEITHEYIGIDIDEVRILKARKSIQELVESGSSYPEKVQLFIEDATNIHLPDGSVDEIILSNTLTAPIHYNWDDAGENFSIQNKEEKITRPLAGDSSEQDLFYRERKAVIDEALRLLKPRGQIVIYTDLIVFGMHSYERILVELSENPSLIFQVDAEEQQRINEINAQKYLSNEYSHDFKAEVLPECQVMRFYKKQ